MRSSFIYETIYLCFAMTVHLKNGEESIALRKSENIGIFVQNRL
jgi:hypothetical protein